MLLLITAVYATIELKGNFAQGSEPHASCSSYWHSCSA